MNKIRITTPENVEVEYTLADIGSRVGANIIDMIIQAVVVSLIGAGILLIRYFSKTFWEEYYGWIIGIALIIYFLVIYGYYILMELTMNGMTIGKKFFKLRTIRNNGQPITIKHSAIRNFFKVFLDMNGLGIIFIFFSKQHKRIGDYAASTIVVMEKDESQPITLQSLESISPSFKTYISEEEYELVSEYLQRKDSMINDYQLRNELKSHFIKKFEKLGMIDEGQKFIEMYLGDG